jgi:hypothetical protein
MEPRPIVFKEWRDTRRVDGKLNDNHNLHSNNTGKSMHNYSLCAKIIRHCFSAIMGYALIATFK